MSVGHSRRTSRKPSPHQPGAAASASCRWASTPSFSSPASAWWSIAWVESETTSAIRISSRSSPLSLRTTIRPGSSSITVGGVIQFSGL